MSDAHTVNVSLDGASGYVGEKTTHLAGAPTAPGDTVIDMGSEHPEKPSEATATETTEQAPPAEEPKETVERDVNLFWLGMQCVATSYVFGACLIALAEIICYDIFSELAEQYFQTVLKVNNAATFDKFKIGVGIFMKTFLDYLATYFKFSSVIGLKVSFLSIVSKLTKPASTVLNSDKVTESESSSSDLGESGPSIKFCDVSCMTALVMFMSLVFLCQLWAGSNRQMRGKFFAIVFFFSQLPCVTILVDFGRIVLYPKLMSGNGSLAHPYLLLAIFITACTLQVIVALFAFLGLMLNGTRAAGYLTSFYHVRKPASTA